MQTLKAHNGVIRSIESVPETDMIITGGLDSLLNICKFD